MAGVAYDHMVDTKEEIVAAHMPVPYGHSCRSWAEGSPCRVGSACWEDRDCMGNLAVVEAGG